MEEKATQMENEIRLFQEKQQNILKISAQG